MRASVDLPRESGVSLRFWTCRFVVLQWCWSVMSSSFHFASLLNLQIERHSCASPCRAPEVLWNHGRNNLRTGHLHTGPCICKAWMLGSKCENWNRCSSKKRTDANRVLALRRSPEMRTINFRRFKWIAEWHVFVQPQRFACTKAKKNPETFSTCFQGGTSEIS